MCFAKIRAFVIVDAMTAPITVHVIIYSAGRGEGEIACKIIIVRDIRLGVGINQILFRL